MSGQAAALRRPNKAAGASVVFLGAFNPALFQPAWFMRHGLVAEDEDALELQAVTPQITSWAHDWLRVVVQPEKCEFHATDEVASYKVLQDMASGVFDLLPHVPVRAFGINRFTHFHMESDDAWHALGFSLFVREPWEGVLDDARMKTVQVESLRSGSRDGAVTATVQPSRRFGTAVFVNINDHYELDVPPEDPGPAVERLADVFDGSLERSDAIIERIRGL